MNNTQATHTVFRTPIGLRIDRSTVPIRGGASVAAATTALRERLNHEPGMLLVSGVDHPGRYSRFDMGFSDPAIRVEARGRRMRFCAVDARGTPLLRAIADALEGAPYLSEFQSGAHDVCVKIVEPRPVEDERERTRQASLFSALRTLLAALRCPDEPYFGLYGAFGYDLVFQFEALVQKMARGERHRDLVLYMPDRLLVVDHLAGTAAQHHYRFCYRGLVGPDLVGPDLVGRELVAPRAGRVASQAPRVQASPPAPMSRPSGLEFESCVEKAKVAFSRGDLFEVTPSRTFEISCEQTPAALFAKLCEQNPAPYGFLVNLGKGEHMIGASPEMFVRVSGREVETCPIAGTVARGKDAFEDAAQIRALLTSEKDEDELTMCTDVDRNDKARVCVPGSIRVLARRDIEKYSRLIHTVDHVTGLLERGRDALDAFLTHCWAVTVTGAPKPAAMQFIEDEEDCPRGFYSGAVGALGMDGHLNTGLVIRTIMLRDGVATVRAGATLLHASDAKEERLETELKASALLAVLGNGGDDESEAPVRDRGRACVQPIRGRKPGRRVLMVDHQDSFVHMLADYFRQAGAEVTTVRPNVARAKVRKLGPELVVLSPGPGRPSDFSTSVLLAEAERLHLPVFGVCLGLQAMAEHCGGALAYLEQPRHGSTSLIDMQGHHPLFSGLSTELQVGRYHSLYAVQDSLPSSLEVLATSRDDGRIMAMAHRTLPWAAVQFHPESVMSARRGAGARLIHNVVESLG